MFAYENIDASIVQDDESPWVPFTPYTDQVFLKYFKIDPVRGEVIALLKAPGNMVLPTHYHGGSVIVYTIEGKWSYDEHDWVAEKGSVVYETACSTHTPRSHDEETITFNITQGDSEYLDAEGNLLAKENWQSHLKRYLDFCEANGIEPKDLTSFEKS